jgi:hypothetical protein
MVKLISRKELGLIFYGNDLALILYKRKNLVPEKIQRMGNYFMCQYGVFGIDQDTRYRHNKQGILIFNSHEHYMPKELVAKFYSLFYKRKFITLKKELEKFYPSIKERNFSSIYEVFQYVVDMTDHNSIDLDTEKYLPYYRAYNPVNKKRTNELAWKGIEAIKNLNPQFKKALPLVAIMIAVVIFAIVWKDIPNWITQIREMISGNMILGLPVLFN